MTSEVMDPERGHPDPGRMTTSTTTSPTTTSTTTGITHPVAGPFLLADAATTAVNGLAYLAAASWLADWFGAPESLLRGVGAFLLAVGVAVAALARRRPIPRPGVLALAVLNVLWVVASLDYAVMGDLTTLGTTWTVLQALVVGVFAAGQAWFVRKG